MRGRGRIALLAKAHRFGRVTPQQRQRPQALQASRSGQSLGQKAAIIGQVVDEHPRFVMMKTRVGGTRVADMLSGEGLPRIC